MINDVEYDLELMKKVGWSFPIGLNIIIFKEGRSKDRGIKLILKKL
jgi:hypothetical protein